MMGAISVNKFNLILLFAFTIFFSNLKAQSDFYGGIKTVVIDPGHGGHDQGCHGSSAKEKDIALAIALKLGLFIEQNYPDINVVYTRKTDVFVELDERAQIANRNQADLFICIHANSAASNASGAETFVLGLNRTESQQKVAERENSAIHLEEDGGEKYKDFDLSVDAIIARQLQLSVFLDHSIAFAARIQSEMEGIGRVNRGVKQAGFLVLYKTTMPSVLIETGFLTNKEEEMFLMDTANQGIMAQSFYNAFNSYKTYYESGYENENEVLPIKDQTKTPKEKWDEIDFGIKSLEIKPDDVIFRVQIATNVEYMDFSDTSFQMLPVWVYFDKGFHKYTAGAYKSFEKANELKKLLRGEGFENAFIVAFKKNERISLEKAIKFVKKD
ncbi:MAG: N-acetylmuramoyl-L-alanine amidase [Crocinitomicaceae bacterium]